MRYTDLARRSEVSEGEVSRHLQRLQSAGLVEKQLTGGFLLTPLARGVLRFEGGLDLLARHREYFRSHDIHVLEERFLLRLEELGYGDFVNDPLELNESVQHVFRSIRTRFDGECLIAQHVAKATEDPSRMQALVETATKYQPTIRVIVQEEDAELGVQAHHGLSAHVEYRTLQSCRVDLGISDTAAVVAFAQRDGNLDYNSGFFGTDPRFLGWCRDYFDYKWSIARALAPARVESAIARVGPTRRRRLGEGTQA